MHTGRVPPGAQPAEVRLRTAERAENSPVALRALPQPFRARLRAIYDVVRTIDDLGDEAPGGPGRAPGGARRLRGRPRARLEDRRSAEVAGAATARAVRP